MHAPSDNDPSKLQTLLLLLRSPATADTLPAGLPVSLHLPAPTFAMVDALSQHSGQSRNRIVCELIDVALAAIATEIGDDERQAIAARQAEIVQCLIRTDKQ